MPPRTRSRASGRAPVEGSGGTSGGERILRHRDGPPGRARINCRPLKPIAGIGATPPKAVVGEEAVA